MSPQAVDISTSLFLETSHGDAPEKGKHKFKRFQFYFLVIIILVKIEKLTFL